MLTTSQARAERIRVSERARSALSRIGKNAEVISPKQAPAVALCPAGGARVPSRTSTFEVRRSALVSEVSYHGS